MVPPPEGSGPRQNPRHLSGYGAALGRVPSPTWICLERSPDRVQCFLAEFLREDVACLVTPGGSGEDAWFVETTGNSPLAKSSLGVLLAALTSVYDTLIAAGYYASPNPLRSQRMLALKQEHIRQVKNAGAPDHAGIRGESWREQIVLSRKISFDSGEGRSGNQRSCLSPMRYSSGCAQLLTSWSSMRPFNATGSFYC